MLVQTQYIIGVITIITIIIVMIFFKKNRPNKPIEQASITTIISDEGRYKEDKALIDDAIKTHDYEMLKEMLNSQTKDFPDLIQRITKALQ